MTEQTSPEPVEGSNSDAPVYAEPQPVPAGPFPTETDTPDVDTDAGEDHPDFLVEDFRDTNDEPADVPAPEQSTESDVDPLDDEEETG